MSFVQVATIVAKEQNVPDHETYPILENFINDMLSKGILSLYQNEIANIVITEKDDEFPFISDKFEITKLIASNTDNKVYLGRSKDTVISNKVIIKAFVPNKEKDTLKEFLKEFKTLEKFEHPNIISLLALGDNYGVVEYFQGKSLSKIVNNTISMQARTLIIEQLISAFAYLHKKNYLHGDLHPSNILVNKKFEIKLIDFDLATSVRSKTSRFGGIREFLAPEIISNDMFDFAGYRPTKRSEVYQLGIMIYFTLYGKFPIERKTWKQHLEALHINDIEFESENQFAQTVDKNLIDLLRQALSFSSQDRPASAVKMQKK